MTDVIDSGRFGENVDGKNLKIFDFVPSTCSESFIIVSSMYMRYAYMRICVALVDA